jgi:hypothetical protein
LVVDLVKLVWDGGRRRKVSACRRGGEKVGENDEDK